MADKKCSSCQYWAKDAESDLRGHCRRYAPRATTLSPLAESTNLDGVWPRTAGDEWCGEWSQQ